VSSRVVGKYGPRFEDKLTGEDIARILEL